MEKIYMEENKQKKQSAFMRTMGSKVPHHLSALMILVAFASFIAIGFSGGHESYAMTQDLGDSFTTFRIDETGAGGKLWGDVSGPGLFSQGVRAVFASNKDGSRGSQIFCLDKDQPFAYNNQTYTRGDLITDPKLMYVLSHTIANSDYQIKDESGNPLPKAVQAWVTQIAIWKQNGQLSETDVAALKQDTAVNTDCEVGRTDCIYEQASMGKSIYDNYVQPILNEAEKATSGQVSVPKPQGNLTVTSDNKYYKTPIITVNGLTAGTTYSMEFKDAPSGIKAYRTNGTEITDLKNVSAADNQFYLLIPIEKATAATKQFTITINAPAPVAYVYNTTGGFQRVTAVVDGITSVGVTLSYTPVVPDTGMNKAQSIYFIGLVVLLCGIGIIYANTKPKKASE